MNVENITIREGALLRVTYGSILCCRAVNYRQTNSWQLIAYLCHVCQQRRPFNISRCVLRGYEQLIGKRHGSQNSLCSGIYSPQQLYHLHDRPASSAISVRATAARLTYRPTVLDFQPVGRACERRSFDCAVPELCKSFFVAGRLSSCHCTACYSHTTKTDGSKFYELSDFL